MGIGLPAHCEAALKSAAARLPGQPDTLECEFASLSGQHLWHEINTAALDAALLLFCPTPTQSLADEAAWRLLAHLLQGPFYQRVRVELQIGYAVFSGIRQINGQTGLLFGVQSPSVSLEGIMEHLRTFLAQLPVLIDASDNLGHPELAQQFTAQALPIAQAAELLWQARLAGHPSDYLARLQHAIQALSREDLQRAAQQLLDAAGGWHCIANGPRIGEGWQSAG
jgi:secreted Zn-dependent insulinase-like peptidase